MLRLGGKRNKALPCRYRHGSETPPGIALLPADLPAVERLDHRPGAGMGLALSMALGTWVLTVCGESESRAGSRTPV